MKPDSFCTAHWSGAGGRREPLLLAPADQPVLSTLSPTLLMPMTKVPAERISIPFKSPGKPLKTLNRGLSVFS